MAFSACAQEMTGSGKTATETRKVSGFKGLEVGGAFEVELIPSDHESVIIEADEKYISSIKTEVNGSTLEIGIRSNSYKNYKNFNGKMKATVYFKELIAIEASGAAKLHQAKAAPATDKMGIELSGAAKADLQIDTDKLALETSGAAHVILAGRADKFIIDISGAGKLEADNLLTKSCAIDVSGAGKADLNVKESLTADASGAGSVRYSGNPGKVVTDVSGAGNVSRK